MNFIEEFKKGQQGSNKGLDFGPALKKFSRLLNGLQKGRIFTIAAGPKTGKTTLVDYAFVINPILYALKHKIPLEIIYFSFEIDRINKEFDFMCYFLYTERGVSHVKLPEGQTLNGEDTIELSSAYLRGMLQDDNEKIIKVPDSLIEAMKELYATRIVPIFGEYDANGNKIKNGIINFITDKDNPTGVYKYLRNHAAKNGTFIKSSIETNARITGYKPKNPDLYTIIIVDHVRKFLQERGFSEKQNVDKWSEYSVELRNLCNYSFVQVIHTNRNIASQDRMSFAKDLLYPTSDDIKGTGNLSEDSNYVITMFNPNDEKYNLKKHFGIKIKNANGNELFPYMRTLHLVESRHCLFPQHFKLNMYGNVKSFETMDI